MDLMRQCQKDLPTLHTLVRVFLEARVKKSITTLRSESMHARISALVLAFVLAFTGLAAAQGTMGTISGRIVDPQGLAVPGATGSVTEAKGAKTRVDHGPSRLT